MMVSACLLAAPIHADDLEKMLSNRQQVLNQFNGGNSTTPSSPATAPVTPARPSYGSPITVQKLLVPSSSRAAAILNGQGQGQGGDIVPQAANYQRDGNADDLIRSAMGLLGVAYRWGGTSVRTGFDCSGFMQHIFRNSMGISLPRTSAMQAQMGTMVSRSELQPGDMVFFRTVRGRISHVGLFIGNNRFIHAPRTGKRIEITSLSNKYWNRKYAFGRRVKKNDPSRFLN
jgi:nlpC/p60 family protein